MYKYTFLCRHILYYHECQHGEQLSCSFKGIYAKLLQKTLLTCNKVAGTFRFLHSKLSTKVQCFFYFPSTMTAGFTDMVTKCTKGCEAKGKLCTCRKFVCVNICEYHTFILLSADYCNAHMNLYVN